jgi:hypothetical protein
LTVPPVDGGAVTVMELADTDPMVAAVDPKSTTVAPEKPLPEMVTVVPPAAGPLLGLTRVTFTPLGGVVVVVVVVGGRVVVVVLFGNVVVVVVIDVDGVVVVEPEPDPKSATSALNELMFPAAMVLVSLCPGPIRVQAEGQPATEEEP